MSESEIYNKMDVMRLEEVYLMRLLIFVFKNKNLFHLHNTELETRKGKGVVSVYPHWNKVHARMQARYQETNYFDKLPENTREEKRISTYKRQIKCWVLALSG